MGELQGAADRLTTENRKLRKYHEIFTEKVVSLFSVDLLRQHERWKGGLDEMRTMAAALAEQRYTAASMQPWLVHWDHQVRKALEYQ